MNSFHLSQMMRILFLVGLFSFSLGCTLGRSYKGSPLAGDARSIVKGQDTRTEILQKFGPPKEIRPQKDGFLFVYRFTQINTWTVLIQEPVFSRRTLFQYDKNTEKSDSMVILFNHQGVVVSYGLEEDTQNLPTF